MRVFKRFTFDAAHSLPHLPEGHKCKRKHGHTYHVEVRCEGPINEVGMVVDYAIIDAAFQQIVMSQLDHQDLDDIIKPFSTCEHLGLWIKDRLALALPTLSEVMVQETATAGVLASIDDWL